MDLLSKTFAALADPTRRAILSRLALGEAPVGDLAQPFRVSAPAISRHLRVLEAAGLIERQTSAQWRVCSLRGDALREASDWLVQYRRFWEEGLDRLQAYLESPAAPPQQPADRAPPERRSSTKTPTRKRSA